MTDRSALTKRRCICGATATQVINAGENKRIGWYCATCGDFVKAIGRERVLPKEKK